MDTKLIEYILTIAKHKSISRAAEELYLTQSALNQQLLKLEKELGAPVFIRTRNRWELTQVGNLYVENGRSILKIKQETYKQIEDLAARWNGTITIGLTPERGIQMFTAIYSDMHARYPETVFQPVEASVDSQIQLLNANRLDFGFQTIAEHKYQQMVYEPILQEPFYLCVPRSHPLACRQSSGPPYPQISLEAFSGELFTLVKKTSTMRGIIDRLFEQAGFKPRLLFESTSMRAMRRLAGNGQCCTVIPRFYATAGDDVSYFSLGSQACWELCAVHAQNHYLNQAARDFIETASAYYRTHPYVEWTA